MSRDGLPRAYLRIDPNLDQIHPDPESFIRLLCSSARQPERGRFRDRALLERLLGKARTARLITRGDLIQGIDGRWYVPGWDEWQEGDMTVAERMKRMRERRRTQRNGDTPPPSPRSNGVTTDAGIDIPPSDSLSGVGVGVETPSPAKRGRRKEGTNPRATGANPRANGHSPRQERIRDRHEAPARLASIVAGLASLEGSA